ncbi:MAG: precorrin-6A reductase, partial [Desulfonatronovibrio sp.]
LGGISEAKKLVAGLSVKNFEVVVSRATKVSQDEPLNTNVKYRHGVLDEEGLLSLAQKKGFDLIIDCTHPYASEISQNAYNVSKVLGVPFLVYDRPGLGSEISKVIWADSHHHAADIALDGRVVFLSVGSNNIGIYTAKSDHRKNLIVRTLPGEIFRQKIVNAGVQEKNIFQATGPFSLQDNIDHFKLSKAEVLVTKDSGQAGGVPAKLEAASMLGIEVIVIRRPVRPGKKIFTSIDDLLSCL